jgi:hypothetical protein
VSLVERERVVSGLIGQGFSRVRSCRVAGVSRGASRTRPKERDPELRDQVENFFNKLRDESLRGAIFTVGAEHQLSLARL